LCWQDEADNGLLAAFLVTLAGAAPSLQVQYYAAGTTESSRNIETSCQLVCTQSAVMYHAASVDPLWHLPFIGCASCKPRSQTLRLYDTAAGGLTDSGLVGIVGMRSSLRQLALIGLGHIYDEDVVTTLAQLPMLQVGCCDTA
jgi:hypothetical protein